MSNPFATSVKILTAVNLLSSPLGATIKKLMEKLNISRRSVFRFLQALTELGFPIIEDQQNHKTEKTYRLMKSYVLKLPHLAILNPYFTEDEVELILSILDFYTQHIQSEESNRLNLIREKISIMRRKEKLKSEQYGFI